MLAAVTLARTDQAVAVFVTSLRHLNAARATRRHSRRSPRDRPDADIRAPAQRSSCLSQRAPRSPSRGGIHGPLQQEVARGGKARAHATCVLHSAHRAPAGHRMAKPDDRRLSLPAGERAAESDGLPTHTVAVVRGSPLSMTSHEYPGNCPNCLTRERRRAIGHAASLDRSRGVHDAPDDEEAASPQHPRRARTRLRGTTLIALPDLIGTAARGTRRSSRSTVSATGGSGGATRHRGRLTGG